MFNHFILLFNLIFNDFYFFFLYVMITLIISCALILLAYILAYQKYDVEKLSGYECGFDPFGDARNPFHIRFYLLSILFIIFDIEVVFFFPWIMSLSSTLVLGFYAMSFFLFVLLIGFVYEWRKKALDWD